MSYGDQYNKKIMDFFHKKTFSNKLSSRNALQATLTHNSCADKAFVQVVLGNDGLVQELHFDVNGCIVAVACANIFAEFALGKSAKELQAIEESVLIENEFGKAFQNSRRDCALLGSRCFTLCLKGRLQK